jgi:hypothetical protein
MTVPRFDVVPSGRGPFEYCASVTPADAPFIAGTSGASGPCTGFGDVDGKPRIASGLWVGGSGNVSLVDLSGASVTFSGLGAGTLLPFRCSRVNSTNTTATLILALF